MWRLVFGLLAGILLASLRAPEGIALFHLPGVPAETTYFVRALALFAIALAAALGRNLFAAERSNADLLWAITAGFLLHSLAPAGEAGARWLSLLVPPAIFVVFVVKWLDPRAAGPDPSPPPKRALVLRLGLFLGGLGAALACEGLARHLQLLGAGTSGDENVFGGTFLILVAFGGLSFGSFLKALDGDQARAPAALVCLPLAAASGWLGVSALQTMASTRELDRFVRRIGLNTADHGTLQLDAALAAPVFVVVAFLIGTALYSARRRSEFSAVLCGAGVALLLVPRLLQLPADLEPESAAFSTQLIGYGAVIAAGGSLLAAVLGRELRVPMRLALAGATIVAASLGPWFKSQALPILSPWALRPAIPTYMIEGPQGLFTVEPSGPGFLHATLGRRLLSPDFDGAQADAARMRRSWDVLGERMPGGKISVLLIGQLTPGRALILTSLGATTIDRTASWSEAMPRLEAELFRNGPIPLPAGSVLSLAEASDKCQSLGYDLVIIPPVPGRAPSIPAYTDGHPTPVVAWFDAGEQLAWRSIERPVLLSAHEFGALSLGIVWGMDDLTTLGRVQAGDSGSAPWPLDWLQSRTYERSFRSQAAMGERLAAGNAEGPAAALTAGLAAHYSAQQHSSPFENESQQIEISEASLELLRSAALERVPDAFTREVWNGLATILTGKRAIEHIYTYIAPIAEAWAPWRELELALAEAELEALEPGAAAKRLEALLAAGSGDRAVRELLARARTQEENYPEAIRLLRGLFQDSLDPRVERQLGLVLFETGDPEGRGILERVFEHDHEDVEVGALLHPERDWAAPHR